MNTRANIYAGVSLDRAGDRRKDPAWIAARRGETRARVVPVWRGHSLVLGPEDHPRAVMSPIRAWDGEEEAGAALVFLGLDAQGVALFAASPPAASAPETHPALAEVLAQGARFVDLGTIGARLPAEEAGVLAYARALVWWNARNGHCPVCGAPAVALDGGHRRVCGDSACAAEHFPRTDPAVLMLVHDGAGSCVLGRQAHWAPGVHSVLAGFVDPGESLEDAVIREAREEVGLSVVEPRYHSSQPWPFPASLMVGFIARAHKSALAINRDELEDARWVSAQTLRDLGRAGSGSAGSESRDAFRLPRPDSLAHRLITDWLALD